MQEIGDHFRHPPDPGPDGEGECKQPAPGPQRTKAAPTDGVRNGHHEGKRNGHGAFRDHAQTDGQPGHRGPSFLLLFLLFFKRQIEGDHGSRDEEHQRAVEDHHVREGNGERHRQHDDDADPTRLGTPQPAREPGHQGGGQKREEERRQPGRGLSRSQHFHGRGLGGKVDDGLVDVGQRVEPRHDVVIRHRHLAANLAVAPFIGVEQWVAAEVNRDGDRGNEAPE